MMQSDSNSSVNRSKTASVPLLNSRDERFCRPIVFKIAVRHQNLDEMQLPPHIIEYIKEVEVKTAILKGPVGNYWHVQICREAAGTFLRDGWLEFRKANSIELDDQLIFRYIGNLFFDIEVLNVSGCEKVYTTSGNLIREKKSTPKNPIEIESSSEEARDMPLKYLEAAPSGGINISRNTNNIEASTVTKKRNSTTTHLEITHFGLKRRWQPSQLLEALSFGKRNCGTELGSDKAGPLNLQASKETPFVERFNGSSHIKRNGRERTQNDQNDRVDMRQLNVINYVPGIMFPGGSSNDRNEMNRKGTSGGKDMDGTGKKLQSRKKKKENEANKSSALPTVEKPSEEAVRKAWMRSMSLKLTNPCFQCSLRKFEVEKFMLLIGQSFAVKFFPADEKTEVSLLNSEGRAWKVDVAPTKGRRAFTRGLRNFMLDNKLKEGDVCVFELLEHRVMQVHVFPLDHAEEGEPDNVEPADTVILEN